MASTRRVFSKVDIQYSLHLEAVLLFVILQALCADLQHCRCDLQGNARSTSVAIYFTGLSCNPQPVIVAIYGMYAYANFWCPK